MHNRCRNVRVRKLNRQTNSSTASNPKHAIFGFLIAVLLALLPLKFGSMNPSAAPFETYSAILSTFLIIMVLYAVAWAIETKLGTNNSSYRLLMRNISFLLGGLATVLLVLILVPGVGYFALVIWTLFLVKFIYEACQKLHQLYGAISLASNLWNELRGRGRGGHGGH
ncbi:Uncharacterized protein TCM_042509 [Theobroma cacao]|uniref:Uncharacterized protein n=1 Tax=Theobroma cacao TaxID=3641 RepID=A0A061FKE4_THECC|nr:Uncharacterized protein TCM_042509 [Theobroma cacao]